MIREAGRRFRNAVLDMAGAVLIERQQSSIPAEIWEDEFKQYTNTYGNPRNDNSDSDEDLRLRLLYRDHLLKRGEEAHTAQTRPDHFVCAMDKLWQQLSMGSTSANNLKLRDEELNKALYASKLSSVYGADYYRQYADAIARGGLTPA